MRKAFNNKFSSGFQAAVLGVTTLGVAGSLAHAGPTPHNGAVAKSDNQLPAGIPGQVTNGFPSHGAFNVDIDTDLAWSPTSETSFYDVRFGTNSNAELNPVLGSTPGTSFALDTLDWNTTYYWRIDSWGSFFGLPFMTPGVPFSFTTELQPVPDFRPIQLVYNSIQEHHIGQSVDIDITVLNQGNGPAAGVVVKTYASLDNVITTDDILIDTQAFNPLGFAAGESHVISYAADIPFDAVSPGAYYFGAIVSDPDLQEADLGNNAVAGGSTASIVHSIPDFNFMFVLINSGEVEFYIDDHFWVNAMYINDGEGPARTPLINIYASLDNTITTDDVHIAVIPSNGTVDSGEVRNPSTNLISFPESLPFGDYYLGAIGIDEHGLEVNLDNNVVADDSIVSLIPHVFDIAAEQSTYQSGFEYVIGDPNSSIVTVSSQVRNNGTRTVDVFIEYYLSQDTVITRDDSLLKLKTWSDLLPGQSISHGGVLVDLLDSPDPLIPGTYYIGVYGFQTVSEVDNTPEDNGIAGGFTITIIGPPPCPADLTGEGDLNFFDVSAFLTAFGNQDPIADFTGEGDFNFFDVSAFLTAFGNGCP